MHVVFLIHIPSLAALDFPSRITRKMWSSVLMSLNTAHLPLAIQTAFALIIGTD